MVTSTLQRPGASSLVCFLASHDQTSGAVMYVLSIGSGMLTFHPGPGSSSSCLSRARTHPAWASPRHLYSKSWCDQPPARPPLPSPLLNVHLPALFLLCLHPEVLPHVCRLRHVQERDWKGFKWLHRRAIEKGCCGNHIHREKELNSCRCFSISAVTLLGSKTGEFAAC